MNRATFTGVLLWLVSTALAGWAQVDTATVVGTIRDSSSAVVPNVTVTAAEMDTGVKLTVKSRIRWQLRNYSTPDRKVCGFCSGVGFRTETRENIVLDVQQNLRLDFQLHVGSVTQTTEVTSEAHCSTLRMHRWATWSPASKWRSCP